jgi:hypothetical protein
MSHPAAGRLPLARLCGVASSSPFAGLPDGPAPDAVVIELGRPTRAALGCFGVTTLFLAALAVAALNYAVFEHPPGALRVVAAVLGGLFLLMVVALATVAVRVVRQRHGVAFDADALWWATERGLARLPWPEIGAVRVVAPVVIRGMRSSAPRTPRVEVCPVAEETIRQYPALADSVTAGETVRADLPVLRFTFRLPTAAHQDVVAAAVARFAPDRWLDQAG